MGVAGRMGRDEGMAIPMVAILLVVIMGMAALSVDLGNGWRTRRSMIPATDAGALAAAQDFVLGSNGCSNGRAATYVTSNEAAATNIQCTPFTYSGGEQGRVTVSADHNVQTWFAGVLGLGNYDVTATSTAVWGPPSGITSARPIAFCYPGSAALQNIVDNPPTTPTDITINYTKDDPNACGTTLLGNWADVDFDGGSHPSNSTLNRWIRDGWDGVVWYENHTVSSCSSEAHCYEGDVTPHWYWNQSAFDDLEDSGQYVTFPVLNYSTGHSQGGKLHFHAFIRARLIDFDLWPQYDPNQYVTLRVMPGLVSGPCCNDGSGAGDNKVVWLCGVDPSAFSACDP